MKSWEGPCHYQKKYYLGTTADDPAWNFAYTTVPKDSSDGLGQFCPSASIL